MLPVAGHRRASGDRRLITVPGSLQVGRLLGIPLRINFSWMVIFAAVTYFLIAGGFPARYPWWSPGTYIVAGILTSVLFFVSVVLHELAHSIVARILGIPVHSITLFIFGGVAQIARDPVLPAGELMMAAAGPLTSLWLAVLFAGIWALSRPFHEPTMALAGWLAWLNLSLGFFNLLPGFPMDGGRVLRSLLWWATGDHRVATRLALAVGRLVAWMFVAGGAALVLTDTRQLMNGMWLAVIGWFLGQAVAASVRQGRLHDALAGYRARDLMSADLAWVPVHATLRAIAEEYAGDRPRRWFLVVKEGVLKGMISAADMGRIPRRRWEHVTAEEAMRPVARLPVVRPEADAAEVLSEMDERVAGEAAVVRDGTLLGILTHHSIIANAGIGRRWR